MCLFFQFCPYYVVRVRSIVLLIICLILLLMLILLIRFINRV